MKRLLKNKASLLSASVVLASLTACGTNNNFNSELNLNNLNQTNSLANSITGKQAKWTIAIHMAADNNLYTAGLDDINEMEAGLSSEDVNVIVLFDGSVKGDSKVYQIKHDAKYDDNIVSTEIDDKGALIPPSKEIDSGDPKVFAKFVDWVTKKYPADNNFVAIWNHGSGIFRKQGRSLVAKPIKDIKPALLAFNSKSFASDDNGGEMNLRDLNPALSLGARNLGKPIDILGFDTCLMGHVETAYQVKGLANYLVASEELEPGDGWDYDAFIKTVSADPSISPAGAAAALVDTYGTSYAPGGSQEGSGEETLSAIDINQLVKGLVPAINDLSIMFSANLPSHKALLTNVRNSAENYYNSDSKDFGHFLSLLSKDSKASPAMKALAASTRKELDKAVIRETHSVTSPRGVANATGLVMYFPSPTMSFNPKYGNPDMIRFAEQKQWGTFLRDFTRK